jgi:hypothetical protein
MARSRGAPFALTGRARVLEEAALADVLDYLIQG